MKYILLKLAVILFFINFNIFPQSQNFEDTLKENDPDFNIFIGNQFLENKTDYFYPVFGCSINAYSDKYFNIPIELLIYNTVWQNDRIFFPRVSGGIKYFPNIFGSDYVFLHGGIGLPLLFYYPTDFNIGIGVTFQSIQIEIREIYYLEVGGQQEINIKHWPMFTLLLGFRI